MKKLVILTIIMLSSVGCSTYNYPLDKYDNQSDYHTDEGDSSRPWIVIWSREF